MDFADEADLLAQLRPRVDGLIIEDMGRRALFLPSVWEQLPEPLVFLAQLRLKAGLAADHWSPGFRASRFQAIEMPGRSR
jgi:AMMECR1 domain-containing protein